MEDTRGEAEEIIKAAGTEDVLILVLVEDTRGEHFRHTVRKNFYKS